MKHSIPAKPASGSRQERPGTPPVLRTGSRGAGSAVFRTLTMPNGQSLRVMREDAFQAALAATRRK